MRYLTSTLLVAVLTALAPSALMGQQDLGTVDFETSCSPEGETDFEEGLALLHHMMYEQARDVFEAVAADDSSCGMAQWGLAMTQLHPLWAPPSEDQLKRGQAAADKARTLDAPTEREAQYISAIATYYDVANQDGHRAGLRAWEEAQNALYDAFPEDVDAGAFWALSHLATAPSDDETFAHQKRAGALLEELLEESPRHPGLFHYLIHAYDNPALAERAVEVARGYDKLAPEVPHALHMPSHIFVRLGLWPDVIEWNRRSAAAALEQSGEEHISHHYSHALDYLMYAHLQQGQNEQARAVLDEITAVERYQPAVGAAYNVPAARARYLLERRKWEKAARLEPRVPSNFPWDDFPQFEAIIHWARGLGAAKTGDLNAAREAVETLEALHQRTLEKDEEYWARLVDVQRKTVEAWILYADGEEDQALSRMEAAADQEDSVDKHPVTPSDVLPARELLGDMLVLLERPEDALDAYETALGISPNRLNSLYGAGRSAEKAGKADAARKYYAQLAALTEEGDSERPELIRAREFLAEH